MKPHNLLESSPLGKPTSYAGEYGPDLLFPVSRASFRERLGITGSLPFYGYDLWNAYEFSWLNPKGKPVSAIVQFLIPCSSPYIIESKSFKLYLNSFHQSRFNNLDEVSATLRKDLSQCVQEEVILEIAPILFIRSCELTHRDGINLDTLDITVDQYTVSPQLLQTENNIVSETVYSDIFKSNCLGTGQPDWGSIQIIYTGSKIVHESLLKYLISYRQHNEFNEHCIERIFMDIQSYCQPQALTVKGNFTRRGGLDTNPCRSTDSQVSVDSTRLFRQ